MGTALDISTLLALDRERLFAHLAHELRQPLSGIESIAFYLQMVLGEAEPEIQQQCERLQRMVQHAHWLLEDTSLALRVAAAPCAPLRFAGLFTELGAELALHEERTLDLRVSGDDPVVDVPEEAARQFCAHLLAFFRGVAQALDPIRVTIASEGDRVLIEVSAAVLADPDGLPRALDPPLPGGGIRRFVEAAQGTMCVALAGERLTLTLQFPRHHGAGPACEAVLQPL